MTKKFWKMKFLKNLHITFSNKNAIATPAHGQFEQCQRVVGHRCCNSFANRLLLSNWAWRAPTAAQHCLHRPLKRRTGQYHPPVNRQTWRLRSSCSTLRPPLPIAIGWGVPLQSCIRFTFASLISTLPKINSNGWPWPMEEALDHRRPAWPRPLVDRT